LRLRTLLNTYGKVGGTDAAILLHNQGKGANLVMNLGKLAKTDALDGVPARVMPVDLHHSASTGMDLWLSAICYGASNVAILVTEDDAPQYVTALQHQISIAQTILNALGYAGKHLSLIKADTEKELDAALAVLVPA